MTNHNDRKRDRIDVRPARLAPPEAPTPEQARNGVFAEKPIHTHLADGSRTTRGTRWQRQPRFETIKGLSLASLLALRHYRAAFDTSEMSATKSALDIRPRGGGGGGAEAAIGRLEAIAFADIELRRIETGIAGEHIPILRAIALRDMDFSEAAIALYGYRLVSQIDVDQPTAREGATLAPRSGRHREHVRERFLRAAAALASRMPRPAGRPGQIGAVERREVRTGAPAAPPPVDPRFLDERGLLRPFDEIREILLG